MSLRIPIKTLTIFPSDTMSEKTAERSRPPLVKKTRMEEPKSYPL
jgi:hypothetical protein